MSSEEPLSRANIRDMAHGLSPEPVGDATDGTVDAVALDDLLSELETVADDYAENGDETVPEEKREMFRTGVLTTVEGIRQQFRMADAPPRPTENATAYHIWPAHREEPTIEGPWVLRDPTGAGTRFWHVNPVGAYEEITPQKASKLIGSADSNYKHREVPLDDVSLEARK